MAKREFELPGIHELSKEQEQAIRLPMEGCHLIVGGPGTGKTVVTLLRLRRYVQQSKSSDSVFLVYNHLLHETARQLFGRGMTSSTWTSWFMRL
jgi:DNA helicase-2/ATP-dependent DNA helicase PcrA